MRFLIYHLLYEVELSGTKKGYGENEGIRSYCVWQFDYFSLVSCWSLRYIGFSWDILHCSLLIFMKSVFVASKYFPLVSWSKSRINFHLWNHSDGYDRKEEEYCLMNCKNSSGMNRNVVCVEFKENWAQNWSFRDTSFH